MSEAAAAHQINANPAQAFSDSMPPTNVHQIPRLTVVQSPSLHAQPRGLIVTTDRQWCASLLRTGLVDVTLEPVTALAWLEDRSYVAVFLDKGTMVGGINGFRLARVLHEEKRVLCPIFLLAENITSYDAEYARQNGARDLLFRSQESLQEILKASATPNSSRPSNQIIDPVWRARIKICISAIGGPVGVAAFEASLIQAAEKSNKPLTPSEMVSVACKLFGTRSDLCDRLIEAVKTDYDRAKRGKK